MPKPVAVFCVTTPMSIPLFGKRFHLLVEAGIDLHIVVGEPITDSIPELPPEAQAHLVPMTRKISLGRDITALIKMVRLQRRLRPQLVAAATPKASLIGLLAARLTRVQLRVWEVWGAKWDLDTTPTGKLLRQVDRIVARNSTDIVAVSPSLKELLKREKVAEGASRVIGAGSTQGVDFGRFHPRPTPSSRREPTVGFVGRLSKDKGTQDAIEVAQLVRKSIPKLRMRFVGALDPTDPPPLSAIETMRKADWIEVTGWVSDTAPHFQEIDVLVFPSKREGLPNVLLEAAASGVPVVAYASTGTVDVVHNEITGILVKVGDTQTMATRVEQLLSDPDLHSGFAKAAQSRASERFRAQLIQRLWTDFYLELCLPQETN